MVPPVAIVLLLVLFLVSPLSCAAETTPDSAIRAIRGPVPPSGLPPFAVTAIVLIGIGSIVWCRRRKAVHAPAVSEPPGDSVSPRALVALLLEEARRRQCHPVEIVERLTPILRSHLAAESEISAEHCTSQELVARLQRTGETDVLPQASRLLRLCDSVRFGGLVPTFEQAEWALQETLLLLQERSEERS